MPIRKRYPCRYLHLPVHERPLAAAGLTSYRCRSNYGWIMIGATDDTDAMSEARRSSPGACITNLEIWNGERYVKVTHAD